MKNIHLPLSEQRILLHLLLDNVSLRPLHCQVFTKFLNVKTWMKPLKQGKKSDFEYLNSSSKLC